MEKVWDGIDACAPHVDLATMSSRVGGFKKRFSLASLTYHVALAAEARVAQSEAKNAKPFRNRNMQPPSSLSSSKVKNRIAEVVRPKKGSDQLEEKTAGKGGSTDYDGSVVAQIFDSMPSLSSTSGEGAYKFVLAVTTIKDKKLNRELVRHTFPLLVKRCSHTTSTSGSIDKPVAATFVWRCGWRRCASN
jgi:hypothetical protein